MSEWRVTAEWDWVQIDTDDLLHAVATLANEDDADREWMGTGETACGRSGEMWIPGLFSRMGDRRCERCCERTGMPAGVGSPKNSEECRPIVEARVRALGGEVA